MWMGVLAVFIAGSSFVGYKLWKRQKTRAELQRWEVKSVMQTSADISDAQLAELLKLENEKLDRFEVLRPVIDELDLVAFWGVANADEAMVKIKESSEFRVGDEPGTIFFVVSDKDKDMAGKLAQAIGRSHQAMMTRDKLMPPPPPPGFQE